MGWWQRKKEGITTATVEKKEAPDGVWVQCKNCKKAITQSTFDEQLHVCQYCGHHHRVGSMEYFDLLFDGDFEILFGNYEPVDMLKFVDLKPYKQRIKEAKSKSGLTEAMAAAVGKIDGRKVVIDSMDFSYIGGSMGSVVGEKIARSIDYCIEHKAPLIIISKSGGARMMEAAFSLMQMIKTSAKLTQLAKAKLPYISVLTDPTTGGVTASYAMLGDVIIAEPNALIGFAGPRVIKETMKTDLPEGFQRSEFLLEHGFIDFITERKELKEQISKVLRLLKG